MLTHLALDQFTHHWGWFARNIDWWSTPLLDHDVLGRSWPPYKVLQYVGHVGGTVVCVWLLARCGRARWMADRAASVAPSEPGPRSRALLRWATVAGLAAGALWGLLPDDGKGALVLRPAGGTFLGLAVGSLLVRRFGTPSWTSEDAGWSNRRLVEQEAPWA